MAAPRLRREIIAALTFKAAALVLLYALFFAPARPLPVSAESVAAHLAGETPGEIR